MSDSLILGSPQFGYFELVDQSTSTPYEVTGEEDIGAPVPDTATVEGVLLDGDRVTGDRSGNRAVILPVRITGASKADVSAKINALIQVVNSRLFTVAWTPDGAQTVILDCFRGAYARTRIVANEDAFLSLVTLSFPALPFGRSASQQTISVGAPSLQLDSFATAPSGASLDTGTKYEGTGSASITLHRTSLVGPTRSHWTTSSPVARTFGSAQDLSALSSVTLRTRWAAPGALGMTFSLTLTSAAGSHTFTATQDFASGDTNWYLVTFPLTAVGSLNLTAVTGYSLNLDSDYITGTPTAAVFRVDDMRAFPPVSAGISTSEGSVLTIPAVAGTARAPVAIAVARSGSTFLNMLLHRPPSDQDPDAAILMGLTAGSATVDAAHGRYNGTYAVVAVLSARASSSRTITLTVTQKIGATTVGTQTLTVTTGLTNALLSLGLLTLPLQRVPVENNVVNYVFAISSTSGSDTFADLALCDTRGQTLMAVGMPSTTVAAYIDEPDPASGVGPVYASATDRTAATHALQYCRTSGGPLLLEPGDNRLLAVCSSGPPNVTVTLSPRWLDEVA